MKFQKKDAGILGVYIALVAVLLIFTFFEFSFTADETANELIKNCVIRAAAGGFAITICCMFGYKRLLNPLTLNGKKSLLWCLPCLFVVLANFPFSALITGAAVVEKTNLIWLFALNCLLIGVFEEFLFRGVFQALIAEKCKGKKYADFLTVASSAALFGLWHLTNLFAGAGIGATVLQVGYSFLIGAMLSAVLIRTGNLWICVLLHALFDFGGYIVTTLGSGPFQDACFWGLTAVCGVICTIHVLVFLLNRGKQENKN